MKSLFKGNDNCQEEQCLFFPFCSLCRTVQDLVGKTEASGCHKVHSRSCVDVNYTLCVSVEVCAASPWVVFEKKIATILV